MTVRVRFLVTFLALVVLAVPAWTQNGPPLPNEETFFAAARENLARAGQEQWRYAYKERRTELHMNPFGRIGSGGTRVFEVVPTSRTASTRRLLERDGKPVPDARPEPQERRQRPQRRSAVEDTVATLRFAITRRETLAGRDVVVVRFEPKPDADPQTREGRLARAFRGLIWVDEAEREVVRVEATAIEDLSFGYGVLARLNKGTNVRLERERVDTGLWLPTSLRFAGEGRAMLFRRLHVDHVIEWFDYRKVL